jgi:hypothetical protein
LIYICIPAHNEEQTVGVVLWKIRQVMAELQRDYQLLVADDASTDRTRDVLEPYTRVLPLTVLRNAERRGYAASLEMLLREAVNRSDYPKRDIVIPLQADFTEEPGHVATLVRRIESGADIVASNSLPLRNAPPLERWRRPLLNTLIRSMAWPAEVRDPLNGFNAYRVFCIRKTLDERKDARLLQLEGWAANAQLLRDAVPHARRVDAVDIQPHAERRQRDSRFVFMPMLRQVLRLRRGLQSEGLRPVTELRPASVMGGPSNQRSLLAESLRESQVRQDDGQRRARNGGGKRTEGAGEARRREQRREKSSPRECQPREKTGQHAEQPRGRNGQPRRTRPTQEKPAAPPTANGPTQEGSTEQRPRKRSRRGRRGSGRSRSVNGGVAGNVAQEPGAPDAVVEPLAAEEPGPDARSDAQAEAQGSMEGAAPRRRRSNRRGGRGRRRRSNGEARTNEQSGAGPDVSHEAGPALEQAPTPKAS